MVTDMRKTMVVLVAVGNRWWLDDGNIYIYISGRRHRCRLEDIKKGEYYLWESEDIVIVRHVNELMTFGEVDKDIVHRIRIVIEREREYSKINLIQF